MNYYISFLPGSFFPRCELSHFPVHSIPAVCWPAAPVTEDELWNNYYCPTASFYVLTLTSQEPFIFEAQLKSSVLLTLLLTNQTHFTSHTFITTYLVSYSIDCTLLASFITIYYLSLSITDKFISVFFHCIRSPASQNVTYIR